MTLAKFIPPFLKKIDRYLLLNYPTIWVTNIHFLLFYGLLLDVSLFAFSYIFTEYQPYDLTFRMENSVLLMVIPVIALFVFWFIHQARYNVDKNYGKLSLRQDFINFLMYWLSTILIYSLVVIIPFGKTEKIKHSINEEELKTDIKTYNDLSVFDDYISNVYYNPESYSSSLISYDPTTKLYEVKKSNAITSSNLNWDNEGISEKQLSELDQQITIQEQLVKLNETELKGELNQLLSLYKKYTRSSQFDVEEVLNTIKTGTPLLNYSSENIDYVLESNYNIKYENRGFHIFSMEYIQIMLIITLLFSMLVWLFKNVHWKNFVAAAVFFVVSPLIYGILFLIFDLLRILGPNEDTIFIFLFSISQILSLVIGLNAYLNKRYSAIGVISIIIFQCATPILFIFYHDILNLNFATTDELFWFCLLFTIVTLPIYKIFYSQMWAFPRNK